MVETYSVITCLPIQPRVAPSDAESVIVVSLDGQDYQGAITCMVALNIPGGGVFDALIAQVALKENAIEQLKNQTLHFRHGKDLSDR